MIAVGVRVGGHRAKGVTGVALHTAVGMWVSVSSAAMAVSCTLKDNLRVSRVHCPSGSHQSSGVHSLDGVKESHLSPALESTASLEQRRQSPVTARPPAADSAPTRQVWPSHVPVGFSQLPCE